MDNETATFDFIDYESAKNMYIDAHSAITRLGLWTWLSNYTPQEGKGFMFSSDPNINSIYGALKTSHSGATFALVMRAMEHIAKYGYPAFADQYKPATRN
jgi:hypothetical protein